LGVLAEEIDHAPEILQWDSFDRSSNRARNYKKYASSKEG